MNLEQPRGVVGRLVALRYHLRISICCRGVSFGRRPPIRPSSRAAASNPTLVRSLSIALSNSVNAPTICIIIRPPVCRVDGFVRLRKPAPASPSRSTGRLLPIHPFAPCGLSAATWTRCPDRRSRLWRSRSALLIPLCNKKPRKINFWRVVAHRTFAQSFWNGQETAYQSSQH